MFSKTVLLVLTGCVHITMCQPEVTAVPTLPFMLSSKKQEADLVTEVDNIKTAVETQIQGTIEHFDASETTKPFADYLEKNKEAALTEVLKLKSLAKADAKGVEKILRTYFDQMLKLTVPMMSSALGEPLFLTNKDNTFLGHFKDLRADEEKTLMSCSPAFLETLLSKQAHGTLTYGELICLLSTMLQQLHLNLRVVPASQFSRIVKTMHTSFIQSAAEAYINGTVSGNFIALPLLVTEKLVQTLPSVQGATKLITKMGVNDSVILEELNKQHVQPWEMFAPIYEAIVSYLESQGSRTFCAFKEIWQTQMPSTFMVNQYLSRANMQCFSGSFGENKESS